MPRTEPATRAIDLRVEIAAPPELVWRALTEAEQLESWFPVKARVTPGVGGSVWVSWGGASTYESRIGVWEPAQHLRLIDQDSDPAGGQPVAIAQDFHIEGRGGTTILRFVHSGFSADAQWDEMFEMMSSGWRYFLFNLKHYLEHHAGVRRALVWVRQPVARPSADGDWPMVLRAFGLDPDAAEGDRFTLSLGGERHPGTIVQKNAPYHFAGTMPDLNDGLMFIELERGREMWHLGFWLSTYGLEPSRVDALQTKLNAAAAELPGPEA